jgi:hypothetical protein
MPFAAGTAAALATGSLAAGAAGDHLQHRRLDRGHAGDTKFCTPAYEEWEAKYLPQPESVPAT